MSDDLTKIVGLGQVSADALVSMGIDTFEKLIMLDDDVLIDMVEAYGVRLNRNMRQQMTEWNEHAYELWEKQKNGK